MLARQEWNKPSLEDFIAWLEMKPRAEKYDWGASSRCACGQYAESIGQVWWGMRGGDMPLWAHLNSLAYTKPNTFGALLGRALAAKASGGFR
jgi:hypothetical protein